jgi:hypothetical protein
VNIDFDPEAHLYVVDGEPFPSVTTIIKAVVPVPFEKAAWYGIRLARQGKRMDETKNQAAAMGTRVHKLFEDIANGYEVDPFDYPEEEGFLQAVDRFITENDPEFHDTEVRTASLAYEYAGTLDASCTLRKGKYKGADVRLDVKTGRVYPESHWPQLEAYENAEIEQGKGKSDKRFVLDLKPTGKYRLVESLDTFDDFYVLLRHYNSVEQRKLRRKKK